MYCELRMLSVCQAADTDGRADQAPAPRRSDAGALPALDGHDRDPAELRQPDVGNARARPASRDSAPARAARRHCAPTNSPDCSLQGSSRAWSAHGRSATIHYLERGRRLRSPTAFRFRAGSDQKGPRTGLQAKRSVCRIASGLRRHGPYASNSMTLLEPWSLVSVMSRRSDEVVTGLNVLVTVPATLPRTVATVCHWPSTRAWTS